MQIQNQTKSRQIEGTQACKKTFKQDFEVGLTK